MSIWFYQAAGEFVGPFTAQQMREFSEAGTIEPFTLVRRGSDSEWVQAGSVKRFIFPPPAPVVAERVDSSTADTVARCRAYTTLSLMTYS